MSDQLSQARLSTVVDAIPAHIAYCDRNCRYLFVNRSYAGRFGLTPESIVGKHIREVLGEEAFRTVESQVKQVLSGQTVEFETEVPLPGDEVRTMHARYVPDFDDADQVVGFVASVRDITREKQRDDQLRQAHSLLEGITKGTEDLIAAEDGHFRYLYFNQAYQQEFQKLWGQKIRVGTSMVEAMAPWPEEQRKAQELWTRALDGETFSVTTEFGPSPQEMQVYDLRFNPVYDANGTLIGAAHILRNVTERVRMQEALAESERRFRSFADTAPAMLWITQPDGACSFLSRGWYEYTGQTEDQALGYRWLDAVHPADRERMRRIFQEANARQEPFSLDYRLRTAAGTYRWAIDAGRPRFGPDGDFLGFIGSVIDVHERKQSEQRLRELNETLEKRVEQRTQQVRRLARRLTMAEQEERRQVSQILHDDLQQLLYAVEMKIGLMERALQQEDLARLARLLDEGQTWVHEAITRTRQLTVDLSPPILQNEGLADALQWLQRQMQELHGLQVTIESDHNFYLPDQDLRVLLFQIVRELLFNVNKHAGVKRATVKLRENEKGVVIHVIDDGQGFSVERATGTPSRGGFGLFSIRERLNLVGGHLHIRSLPGQGTHVVVHSPRQAQ